MDVVPIVNGASSVAQATKAPMPKSPFVYPDLCGRHRLQVEVQMMDREIGFLEEELNSLNELQPASRCCEEVNASVESKADPLLPLRQRLLVCADTSREYYVSTFHVYAALESAHPNAESQNVVDAVVAFAAPMIKLSALAASHVVAFHASLVLDILVVAFSLAVTVKIRAFAQDVRTLVACAGVCVRRESKISYASSLPCVTDFLVSFLLLSFLVLEIIWMLAHLNQ